jgi:hypothetical protein
MPQPTPYEIVLRGRVSARLLRPLLDDFTIDNSHDGVTSLFGDIRDASHLHGLLAHLTAVNVEVISIAPRSPRPGPSPITADPQSQLVHAQPTETSQ